jgi:hypothetical protein
MRRIVVLTLAITVMLVLPVPAGATPPSDVLFEVETSFIPPAPFTASGPAVDDGLVCDSGIVVNASSKVAGFSLNGFNFQGIKHFTCDDGSGEFFVNLQARIFFDFTPTKFQWNVVGGTGDYESLRGAGRGVGIAGVPCGTFDCVLDVYDGGLNIDP